MIIKYQQRGNVDEAIQHALKCLEIEKSALGEHSLQCVGSYLTLGDLYSQSRDNTTALKYYDTGLLILNDLKIENSILNFNLLMERMYVHLSNNDIQTAFSEMKRIEKISEYHRTEEDDEYPAALVDLLYARINVQKQDYERASIQAVNAFNSLLSQYTTDNEDKFYSIIECLSTLIMISQYDLAISIIQDFLNKNILSLWHKGYILSCLADCTGDIRTYEESIEILSESKYIDMYNSPKCMLGNVYEQKGDVLKAIDVYKQVCDYYSKEDPESPTYRKALMSLGDVYEGLGNYDKACEYYRQILNILESQKHKPDYFLTFMRWLPIYINNSVYKGDFLDFENSYSQGSIIGEELKNLILKVRISDFLDNGIGLPTIANVMLSFYHMLLSYGMMSPWISWYQIEKQLHELTYDYLMPICSDSETITHQAKAVLAHAKYLLGKYDESIALINEVISACKRFDYPYENYLHDLAYYQYDSGDKAGAYKNFEIGYDFNKNTILSGYRWMTTEERDNLTRTHRGNLDNMPHYAAITPEDSRYAELGYNALLFTKGLLLNSSIELSRLLQEEGDNSTLNLLNQWRKRNQEYQVAM